MPTSTWQAIFDEVKQQVAQVRQEDSNVNNSWLDLAEDTVITPAQKQATRRWQQQQWQNAFEVLVCLAAPPLALF